MTYLYFDKMNRRHLSDEMRSPKRKANSKKAANRAVNDEWLSLIGSLPSQKVGVIFHKRRKDGVGSANWNGYLFEALIYRLLLDSGISHNSIFSNARLALIHDTKYDIILCGEKQKSCIQFPICLSLKTSLRERYKQAEREGMIAKQVHRGSFTALLTMEDKTPETLYGLDRIVRCSDSSQLASLVDEIKSMNPIPLKEIMTIGRLVS